MNDKSLQKIEDDITKFESEYKSSIGEIATESEKLYSAAEEVEASWSGSHAGWHGSMYYRDFEKPTIYEKFSGEWGGINGIPEGWEEKTANQVRDHIYEISGKVVTVDNFEQKVKNFRSGLKDLQQEVNLALAVMDFEKLEKEKALADQLESFSFKEPRVEYVSSRLPKNMMSRDTEALRQGTYVPAWLYCKGAAHEGEESVKLFTEYAKSARRLIKQVGMRSSIEVKSIKEPSLDLGPIHEEIKKKCLSLYQSKSYPEAVEKSFKIVKDRLRTLTGYESGSEAFGKGKLHIKGAAAVNVDADFNKAAQFLMMAIDMFRNEKSHTSDAKIDDPIRAYQYLAMSSLALALLDDTEITP